MLVNDSPDLAAVRQTLLDAESVVITSHQRPDGDAVGTEAAIGRWLKGLGKKVLVLNADPFPRNLDWFAEEQPRQLFRVYDRGALKHAQAIADADALLVVDTNARHRLGEVGTAFAQSGKPVLLLDHHPDPEGWFAQACVRTDAAAACEIAYDLIAGHDPEAIDRGIATALYVGIMTDTGSFRYGATTPRTHAIVADVLERGDLRPEPIHVALFDGKSRQGLALLSAALATITTHHDGRLATMVVTDDMVHAAGAFFDETEGLINYALALEGVIAAVIFLGLPSGVKLSFRSKGDCPINGWAAGFGGGGHANASGAFVDGAEVGELLRRVVDAAPRHVVTDVPESDVSPEISTEDLDLLKAFQGKL